MNPKSQTDTQSPTVRSREAEPKTLQQMASIVNGANVDNEVVVFEQTLSSTKESILPLRVDALMVILIHQGRGRIGIDLKEFEIKPGTLLMIQPENYLCLSQIDEPYVASVLACSSRIVSEVLPKLSDLLPLILHHRVQPVSFLKESQVKQLSAYASFIKEQLNQPCSPFRKQKVIALLQAALYEVMDIDKENNKTASTNRNRGRKDEIMARFIMEVSQGFRQHRQVAYYAARLSITPKHLSSVVKELSGRTAGEWIETYVIMEAKVLLKTTDKPIQEIAAILNFPNQSFFGKYFKYQTGSSPSQYRRQ